MISIPSCGSKLPSVSFNSASMASMFAMNSVFVYMTILLFHLFFLIVLLDIEFLFDSFSFQHSEYVIALFSSLHCCWSQQEVLSSCTWWVIFSLAVFKILFVGFSKLTIMCLDVVLFVFILLGVYWHFWVYK